jgi:hypothetical protein
MSYAWTQYYNTAGVYKGYLLKWDNAGSLDISYKRSLSVSSYYGTITGTNVADNSNNWYGQCVSFVKSVAKSSISTGNGGWLKGRSALWSYTPVARGTAIAKFNADGTYDSWGGTGHVAIFDRLYYESGVLKGILVWDQNYVRNCGSSDCGLVGYHMIPITGTGGTTDAAAYYVVTV